MNINEMRRYVSDSYPGLSWKSKVARMPQNQVIAIYKSLLNREKKEPVSVKAEEPHQMDIWEWAYECNAKRGGKETHTNIN